MRSKHDYIDIQETSEGWEVTFLEPNINRLLTIEVTTHDLKEFKDMNFKEFDRYLDNEYLPYIHDEVIDCAVKNYLKLSNKQINEMLPKKTYFK